MKSYKQLNQLKKLATVIAAKQLTGWNFLATSLSRWPLRLLVRRVWSLLNIRVISSYCRLLPCNAREKISLIGCAGHSKCIGQNMRENFSRMRENFFQGLPIGSIHIIAFIQWAARILDIQVTHVMAKIQDHLLCAMERIRKI